MRTTKRLKNMKNKSCFPLSVYSRKCSSTGCVYELFFYTLPYTVSRKFHNTYIIYVMCLSVYIYTTESDSEILYGNRVPSLLFITFYFLYDLNSQKMSRFGITHHWCNVHMFRVSCKRLAWTLVSVRVRAIKITRHRK